METMLLVVTLGSLILAIGMSVIGWKLLRGDRRRSDARVEELRAEALGPQVIDAIDAIDTIDTIDTTDAPLGVEPARFARIDDDTLDQPNHMFAASDAQPSRPRFSLAFAGVATVVVAGIATAFMLHQRMSASAGAVPAPAAIAASGADPIELIALNHHAEADGTFTIAGEVSTPVTSVMAVIYIFDRDDRLVASRRAPLEERVNATGAAPSSASFIVRLPDAGDVGRYRVTFQRDNGRVIPHLDHRLAGTAVGRAGADVAGSASASAGTGALAGDSTTGESRTAPARLAPPASPSAASPAVNAAPPPSTSRASVPAASASRAESAPRKPGKGGAGR